MRVICRFLLTITVLSSIGCVGNPPDLARLPALDAVNSPLMNFRTHVYERINERMRQSEYQQKHLNELRKYYARLQADGPGWFTDENALAVALTRILKTLQQRQSIKYASAEDLFNLAVLEVEQARELQREAQKKADPEERKPLLLRAEQFIKNAKEDQALAQDFFESGNRLGKQYRLELTKYDDTLGDTNSTNTGASP